MNFYKRLARTTLLSAIVFSLTVTISFADLLEEENEISVITEFSSGYRHDDLQWSIAGDSAGFNPNILSELTWTDIQSWQVQGKGQVILNATNIVLDGRAAYASIFSGDNQDSDYSGDNRTLEFSRSNNSSDEGKMFDFSGGIGFRVNLEEYLLTTVIEKVTVTPLLGFSYNKQNLRVQDGFQTIPATGAFANLNSTYETDWYGPWIGVEVQGKIQQWAASMRFEYHVMEYYADADWNLRSDFQHPKSFEHKADAQGIALNVGLRYALTEYLDIFGSVDFYKYDTDAGVDTTFFSDGSVVQTQLNVVEWESYAVQLGLRYRWF